MDPDKKLRKSVYLEKWLIEWLEAVADERDKSFNEQVGDTLKFGKEKMDDYAPEEFMDAVERQLLENRKEYYEQEAAVINEKLDKL